MFGNGAYPAARGGTVTATGGEGGRAIGAGNGNVQTDPAQSDVSIAPGADNAMLIKFADAPVTDWSGVTDSVSVGFGSPLDYKADAHYDMLCARISTAYAVSGTVQDEADAPVAGATASCGGQSVMTDDDGAYTLMLENGSHVITAAKGNLRGTINVTVGNATLTGQDITLVSAGVEYEIIRGAGGEWTRGTTGGLGFTADVDYSKFTGVSVDGRAISDDNYDSRSGSTIVTLKDSYLATLSAGTHTVRISFTNGYAEASFLLKAAGNPGTGDSSMLWLCIAAAAATGLAAALVLWRRTAVRFTKI